MHILYKKTENGYITDTGKAIPESIIQKNIRTSAGNYGCVMLSKNCDAETMEWLSQIENK